MHPFTHAQLAAMTLKEQLLRLLASQGVIECVSGTTGLPVPWWLIDPWMRPIRHLLPDLLGDPPRPFPPATCSGWEDVIDKIADALGSIVEDDYPATVLACLISVNDSTNLETE